MPARGVCGPKQRCGRTAWPLLSVLALAYPVGRHFLTSLVRCLFLRVRFLRVRFLRVRRAAAPGRPLLFLAGNGYEVAMWVSMSAGEREEFLAGVHVGVLAVAMGTEGRTLTVPVWYSYRPGGLLTVITGRRSRKGAAIGAAGRFGLCVQHAIPPYRYVSVDGPVVATDEPDPAERLALARRYLGTAGGDRYIAANPDPGHENAAFRMRPEHWLSQDQGKG